MFRDSLARLEKVHTAQSRAEIEAIYRFRYTVFVEELGREIGGVDHDRRWVHDREDEQPYTFHAYTGKRDAITGSMRLRFWNPGEVPEHERQQFSMDQIPGIDGLSVAEGDRFMISRSLRGRLILPSMMRSMFELLVVDREADLVFCCCGPGLVRHYRKLGFQPYRAKPIHSPEGMRVPLIAIPSDIDYAKSQGSFLVPLMKKEFGRGGRRPLELEPFRAIFDQDSLGVELDAARVWRRLQQEILHDDRELPSFLDTLDRGLVRQLSERGFVLDVPDGTLLTREGFSEQEMYVVLTGSFEVLAGQRRIALATKGDLLGEVAFFRESGKRSASIRAVGDSQVLMIRRKFLRELASKDPEAAFELLFRLAGILSERLVSREAALHLSDSDAS
jgi:N-acyl-L-homoserine lactone synthetase